ncbi:hypothetical protein OJAV_G00074920 [Oryzias javanicus]|uniref:Uncharacterized protein n=1 Tax=Oryzias javanicus TaxID=123683 RepID=A0A3S2PB59_ORYJA|nr:hypothetical protein OJAV_G00074920 [Oryzias javanicus]
MCDTLRYIKSAAPWTEGIGHIITVTRACERVGAAFTGPCLRWNHLRGARERGNKSEEGAGVRGPRLDPQAPRLCSAPILSGGEDKRKEEGGKTGGKARDCGCRDGGPPDSRRRWSGSSGLRRLRRERRSGRLEAGVSCHSCGIVTKQPFSLRGASYRCVFRTEEL